MRADDLRPDRLTVDLVWTHFVPLIRHRIRKFQVSESVEDCLQQVILAMIVPSETLGTSFLDRYDPSRGPAQHYVLMFATQQMMKLHAREKTRREILPEPVAIDFTDLTEEGGTLQEFDVLAESTIPDPKATWETFDREIRRPEDLRLMLKGTRHAECRSHSPSGEPRSTLYMLELLLWGGFSIAEIATRLAITSAEVHRRFKLLRKEPRLQALLNTPIS
jgi:DNA-directed RNA polymerase specialized sigma24 family protein